MRTLDPDLTELRALVDGDHPPTWIVEWVDFEAWNEEAGARLRADVEERYVEHGLGCDDRPVYLLRASTAPSSRPTATSGARNDADPSEDLLTGQRWSRWDQWPWPCPWPPAAAGSSSSGFSTISVSVVSSMPAIEVALISAERVTFTGSRTPWATRSPYSSVAAL